MIGGRAQVLHGSAAPRVPGPGGRTPGAGGPALTAPDSDPAQRAREICLSLPGVTERPSHGSPAFFAGRQFVMLWPEGHHDHGFPHLWCAAPPGAQAELAAEAPAWFFVPPYVGGRGWLGVRLDTGVDDDELRGLCEDAFRTVAPARLITQLEGR